MKTIKAFIHKIICFLWRYSNTYFNQNYMNCTFCGKTGMHMRVHTNHQLHFVCERCEYDYKQAQKQKDYSNSYWGGLYHRIIN